MMRRGRAHGGQERGADPRESSLAVGIFGAEPWTNAMRQEIEQSFDMHAVDIYGLSEVMGPGVASECVETKDGLHIWEDHFYPEIIDPATGEVLPDGEMGELVFTTLTKEALPLVRYRTADIASITLDACPCGRTLARMSPVRGRRDAMLIIRGVNLYPSEVEHALLGVDGVAPHYQLVVERPGELDQLTVHCEPLATRPGSASSSSRRPSGCSAPPTWKPSARTGSRVSCGEPRRSRTRPRRSS